jgi:esterase/lipase superfamily enzyme
MPVAAPALGAHDHEILVASTRERDARPGTLYNGERSASLSYASVTVSVPPDHAPGAIEWASDPPGAPDKDFVARDLGYLDGDAQFLRKLNSELARRPAGHRQVTLFVHGYNTMFAEGLYRLAQVAEDSHSTAAPVLFTWASRGDLSGYLYDNNSATMARDALAHTLRLLFASDADRINILAHSMGNWVTVEALRQIKLAGGMPHKDKFGAIMLASPDIDIDVFKSELRSFGKLKKPFFIVLSRDDKALAISRVLAGGKDRVGDYSNSADLAALGAVVIDLTQVKGDDPTDHAKFAQLAQAAPELAPILERGISEQRTDVGETVRTGVGNLIAAPIVLVTKPLAVLGATITVTEQR